MKRSDPIKEIFHQAQVDIPIDLEVRIMLQLQQRQIKSILIWRLVSIGVFAPGLIWILISSKAKLIDFFRSGVGLISKWFPNQGILTLSIEFYAIAGGLFLLLLVVGLWQESCYQNIVLRHLISFHKRSGI